MKFSIYCAFVASVVLSVFSTSVYTQDILIKWHDLNSQYQNVNQNLQLKEPQTDNRHFSVFEISNQLQPSQQLQIIYQLRNLPSVEWVTQDGAVLPQLTPNDEFYDQQKNWLELISMPQTWNAQTDCQHIVVAVIDSGMDVSHPDLQANLWRNPLEIADDGVDNDNNGYIDDIHGWNTINENNNLGDRFGHGTHVSGTLGATSDNQKGVVGVCWNANILPVKFLDDFGSGSLSNAAQAIDYVLTIQKQFPDYKFIINNSWTAPYNIAVEEAFKRATESGVLVVNAAGNSGLDIASSPTYPAIWSRDNLSSMTVANLDHQATILDLNANSNYDPLSVTLAAPGSHILSTWPVSESVEGFPYEYKDGTSMATPVVSGVAALLWHKHPTLNAQEIRAILEQNSQPLGTLQGKVSAAGYVNSEATLNHFKSDISSLGYFSWESQRLQLTGVNLDLIDTLTLNNAAIDFERLSDTTLELLQPNSLRCGNLSAIQSDDSTTNQIYFDWAPNTPTSLNLNQNSNGDYVLSWQSNANVDQIELYTAGRDGQFEKLKTVDNNTQSTTLEGLDSHSRIKARSIMQCYDQKNEVTKQFSAFSAEVFASEIVTPKWLTTSISSPAINQPYYQPLEFNDATEVSMSIERENLPSPACIPTGISVEGDALIGTVQEPLDCYFDLVAKNTINGTESLFTTHFKTSAQNNDPLEVLLSNELDTPIINVLSKSPISAISIAKSTPINWQLYFSQLATSEFNQLKITLLSPDLQITQAELITEGVKVASTSNQGITLSDKQIELIYNQDNKFTSENGFDVYKLNIEVNSNNNVTSNAEGSSDSRCFIASSVYQSHTAKPVQEIRDFRDWLLTTYPKSEIIIEKYYNWSPLLVEWMKRHPAIANFLRPILRWKFDIFIKVKRLLMNNISDE